MDYANFIFTNISISKVVSHKRVAQLPSNNLTITSIWFRTNFCNSVWVSQFQIVYLTHGIVYCRWKKLLTLSQGLTGLSGNDNPVYVGGLPRELQGDISIMHGSEFVA